MSAKWRRTKRKSRRFDIFKAFKKTKSRDAPRIFRVRGSKISRRTSKCGYPVQEFSGEKKLRAPAPLIDVLEGEDDVAIVAELAGFNKESLKINLKDQMLTLSAENSDRRYRKSLNLPKRVIPSTMHTTYKNGVLEIRLRKAGEEKALDEVAG